MSANRIFVDEDDINDDFMRQNQQYASPPSKSFSVSLPRLPKINRKRTTSKRGSGLKAVAVIILIMGATGGFLYQYNSAQRLKKENEKLANPQAAAIDEAAQLRNEISQYIELPNENATLATVVDASKLKDQAFFTNAQNGDKVLLFTQAKKAVLYRPSARKIIEVAPINIGDTTGVAGTSTATPAPNNKN